MREEVSFLQGDTLLSPCRTMSKSSPPQQEKIDVQKGSNRKPQVKHSIFWEQQDLKHMVLGEGDRR